VRVVAERAAQALLGDGAGLGGLAAREQLRGKAQAQLDGVGFLEFGPQIADAPGPGFPEREAAAADRRPAGAR